MDVEKSEISHQEDFIYDVYYVGLNNIKHHHYKKWIWQTNRLPNPFYLY